jgi:hypothetical protein
VRVLVEQIDDAEDPRLADYRDFRGAVDTFVVEAGSRCRSCTSRFRLRSVLTTRAALADVEAALHSARGRRVRLSTAADTVERPVGFPFHRGCLGGGQRGDPLALDDLIRDARPLAARAGHES